MNAQRLEYLKKHIDKLEVDPEKGIVKGRPIYLNSNGRLALRLHENKKYYVHEIIAFAGGLDLLNKTVDHINIDNLPPDENKLDNRIANLEAVTRAENARRQNAAGLIDIEKRNIAISAGMKGKNTNSLYTPQFKEKIRKEYAAGGITLKQLVEKYGGSIMSYSRFIRGKTCN